MLDPSLRLDSDLKLDSLGRVELLSLLEDHYQVELDEARMTSATTLGDVEEQLKAQWVQQQTEMSLNRLRAGRETQTMKPLQKRDLGLLRLPLNFVVDSHIPTQAGRSAR